jgi:hypothetical protein
MAITGRIFDRFVARFGAHFVYMDINNIPYGTNYRKHIDDALNESDVLVAIVGPDWLRSRNDNEPARILDTDDPIRLEIQTALQRNIKVIPVLVDGTKMPRTSDLPRSLEEFAFLNAIDLESGRDFDVHMERLIRAAELIISDGRPSSGAASASASPRPAPPAAAPEPVGSEPDVAGVLGGAQIFFSFVLVPALLVLLAHYLIVVKFDLSPVYLRIVALLVPLTSGYCLARRHGRRWRMTLLCSIGLALITVLGMAMTISIVDGTPIVPTTLVDRQEAAEYFLTVVLAAVAGHVIAATVHSKGPKWL